MVKINFQYHCLEGGSHQAENNYIEHQKSTTTIKCAQAFLEGLSLHFRNSTAFEISTSQVGFPLRSLLQIWRFSHQQSKNHNWLQLLL